MQGFPNKNKLRQFVHAPLQIVHVHEVEREVELPQPLYPPHARRRQWEARSLAKKHASAVDGMAAMVGTAGRRGESRRGAE